MEKRYLYTLVNEKGIDLDTEFSIEGNFGLTIEVLIQTIENLPFYTRGKIYQTFRRLDSMGANVMHYFEYLAKALSKTISLCK